jgi:SAM-dependent methyltransferase
MNARHLLDLWDRQQAAYVAHREARFEAMLTVLELHCLELPCGDAPTVLDLACGPGAISDRVLAALPKARTIAVDYDPVLLAVARGALGDRTVVHDLDLVSEGWERRLGVDRVDAVLSSTALHWLSPAQLLGVYQACARLLPPGGLLLNADHLRFGPGTRQSLAERHDARTQASAFELGALDYAAWHAEALREPELAALAPERERRFADRPPQPPASLEFHLAALRTAGFAEAGPVWQYLDDYVVLARR